jgi:2-aminoadipate transaminase
MFETTRSFDDLFAERIKKVPRSFIRDILSVTNKPDVISFAGGLPNSKFFPLEKIRFSVNEVLGKYSFKALQYATTEGLYPLKIEIAEQYRKTGLIVNPDNILITNGSQQALDLIGKVLINKNDTLIIEEPAYLGAIQAFSMYQPKFIPVPLHNQGIDLERFEKSIQQGAKLAYLVPNFQNPTGITYDLEHRQKIAEILRDKQTLLVEDDPYGNIRFHGGQLPNLYSFVPSNTILLGTFSKTVAPGFRIGWMILPEQLLSKFVVAKQASDLHSDIFAQYVLYEFLSHFDMEGHLQKIRDAYSFQAKAMTDALAINFPHDVTYTKPNGGMFTWVSLPEGSSSMRLFEASIRQNVAFVPGVPFYLNKSDSNTLRLNFSCSGVDEIKEGIRRLADVYLLKLGKYPEP